jgi:hypothetical protein
MPDNDGRKAPSRWPSWLPQQIELSEVQNSILRKGFALWTRKKGKRRMAARDEMSPRDMSDFLRNIVLVKVLDGGNEFQFRIVGDAIVVVQGTSFQGKTTAEMEQAFPGYGDSLREVYKQMCATKEPLAFRGNALSRSTGRSFFHETLLLPLGADGETVDHILVIAFYTFGPGGPQT